MRIARERGLAAAFILAACLASGAQEEPAAQALLRLAQTGESQSAPQQAQSQAPEPSSQQTPPQPTPQSQSQQAPPPSPEKQQPKDNHEGAMGATMGRMKGLPGQMRDLPAQWFLGSYVPANASLQPLTLQQRSEVYVRQTYLTGASYLKRLFGAGIDQARGVPAQWEDGWAGYGQRFGSRYGQFIIQNSIAAAGNAALGYEPRYDYCRCTGFWPRTKHAIARNFVTYNETESERRPQIPLYVGAFGAGALATMWKPANESPWKNAAYAVAGQMGYGSLSNWVQEFALDIGHKLARKRRLRGGSGGEEP